MVRLRRLRPKPLPERLVDAARRIEGELANSVDLAVLYWNLYHSQEIVLDALAHPWRDLTPDDLLSLPEDVIHAADELFECTTRFAVWARHTEAMPATFEARILAFLDELRPLLARLESTARPSTAG